MVVGETSRERSEGDHIEIDLFSFSILIFIYYILEI